MPELLNYLHFDYSALLISSMVVIACIFAYQGASLKAFSALLILGLAALGIDQNVLIGIIIVNLIFLTPFLRRNLLTNHLVRLIKKTGMLPNISPTEETALRAGNVWIEGELFSGKPDFSKIYNDPYNKLSKIEQKFLNNQVNKLCQMTDDWQVFADRDLPKEVWDYMKKEKFFGMMIPKKYGGLGFSALAHSEVVAKLATRSQVLAITVMVPNSLGPGELLHCYGTDSQKKHYLPRLADGRDIPCFGLTEPQAGSDATSISAMGEVFKDKNGTLKIKLNFRKRYITLGAVAGVIGLAFQLKDPNNLLKKGKNIGISCALINSKAKGITIRRHDPLGVPFVNATLIGKSVVIPAKDIIGGTEQAGNGWKMLMECLSVGRGISLPATSTGGAKLVARVVGDYAYIRRQFGLPIGKFEGIEEPMAEIAGFTYMLDAARIFTASSIDNGYKPAVANALAKYHFTERFRDIINHGMDILGGAAICRGPRNLLAHPYFGTPIAITVEGANIMTRSLIHFGQGAVRCHPYSYHEITALMAGDTVKFDHYFFKHIGHLVRNKARSVFLSLTRGRLHIATYSGMLGRYEAKLAWASASFAYLADVALAHYGGNIKRKERLTSRFGDILSAMYLASGVMRRYIAEGQKKEDQAYFKWAMEYCFYMMHQGFSGIFANFSTGILGKFMAIFGGFYNNLNPIGSYPSDKLGHKLASSLMQNDKRRDNLTANIFIPTGKEDQLNRLEECFKASLAGDKIMQKIKLAARKGRLNYKSETLLADAFAKKIISKLEKTKLEKLAKMQLDAVEVDSFEEKDYKSHQMKKSKIY